MTDRAINYSLFAQSYSAKQSSIHRTLKAPTERERKKRDRDSAVSDYFPISPLLVLEIQVVTTLYDSVHWKVTTSADFPPATLSLSLSLSLSLLHVAYLTVSDADGLLTELSVAQETAP